MKNKKLFFFFTGDNQTSYIYFLSQKINKIPKVGSDKFDNIIVRFRQYK